MLRTMRHLMFATAMIAPATALSVAAPALASEDQIREATIMVSGEGEATIAPDMAILSLAVVREAETAEEALRANSQAMADVLADLKGQGIADKDLQTSNFSVQPRYEQRKSSTGDYEAPEIVGYTVTNGLTVRVRDLSALGSVIDRAVKLGVNQGGDIVFTNDDPAAAIADARRKAVAEAMEKAKTLTEAAGVTLGRVIEISENFARPMPQPAYRAMAMSKDMAMEAAPIASGENRYSVTVNMTYGLEQ